MGKSQKAGPRQCEPASGQSRQGGRGRGTATRGPPQRQTTSELSLSQPEPPLTVRANTCSR
jgi:hypothetical protein